MPAKSHWFRKPDLPPSLYRFLASGAGRLTLFALPIVVLVMVLLIWSLPTATQESEPAPATDSGAPELQEEIRRHAEVAAQTRQAVTVLAEELATVREDYQELRQEHQQLRQELSAARAELEQLRAVEN